MSHLQYEHNVSKSGEGNSVVFKDIRFYQICADANRLPSLMSGMVLEKSLSPYYRLKGKIQCEMKYGNIHTLYHRKHVHDIFTQVVQHINPSSTLAYI